MKTKLILDSSAQHCGGCCYAHSGLNKRCRKHEGPDRDISCVIRTNRGEKMGKFVEMETEK